MSASRLGLSVLLALGGLASLPTVGPHGLRVTPTSPGAVSKSTPWKQPACPEHRAAWAASRRTSRWAFKYPKPGWSVKQGQRMARKRKNKSR